MSVIYVEHLTKSYRSWKKQPGFLGTLRSLTHREYLDVDAVRDVSFSIDKGEFVGFIGPNGAGKTTTLKMLSGILWPTSGSAEVLGSVPWKRQKEFQRRFAVVLGQKNQLWWDLPAKDSFLLNKEIYQIPKGDFDQRLKELGELLGVEHLFSIPVNRLSLGERMKCELINALLHQPEVLLLDEPTIGLDVLSQQAIRDFLKRWNKQNGATIILTSHAMADVEALCRRILIINKGALRYDGPLEQLVKDSADRKEVRVTFSQPVRRSDLETFGPTELMDPQRALVRIRREEIPAVTKALLEKFPVIDLDIHEVPIDDVIRTVFKT